MNKKTFLVFSYDDRQKAIHHYLLSNGISTIFCEPNCTDTSIISYIEASDIIICPTPCNEIFQEELISYIKPHHYVFGGKLSFSFIKKCNFIGAKAFDLLKDDILSDINALYTAEGTIGNIITSTPFALANSKCLLTGFGKCGKHLAHLLQSFGTHLDIIDCSRKANLCAISCGYNIFFDLRDIAINKYNIIINTVPENIFTNNQISDISDECYVYDIASAPFGFSDEAAVTIKHLTRLPGIPGKLSPISAGELIIKTILSIVETK